MKFDEINLKSSNRIEGGIENGRPIDVTAVAGSARLLSIENVQLSIWMDYAKMEYRCETMLNIHVIASNN